MEWAYYAGQNEFHPVMGPGIIDFFTRHGYTAWHITGAKLDMESFSDWPNDIMWVKTNASAAGRAVKNRKSMHRQVLDKLVSSSIKIEPIVATQN